MEARSWLRLLTGASLISALAAMMGGRAPRWLRIMLVLTTVVVALKAPAGSTKDCSALDSRLQPLCRSIVITRSAEAALGQLTVTSTGQ